MVNKERTRVEPRIVGGIIDIFWRRRRRRWERKMKRGQVINFERNKDAKGAGLGFGSLPTAVPSLSPQPFSRV
jgi:hypothetical protein